MLAAQRPLSPRLPVCVTQSRLRSRCHLKKAACCDSVAARPALLRMPGMQASQAAYSSEGSAAALQVQRCMPAELQRRQQAPQGSNSL